MTPGYCGGLPSRVPSVRTSSSQPGNTWLVALLPASREDDNVVSHGGLTYGGFVTDHEMSGSEMEGVFASALSWLREHGVRRLIYKSIPHIYHTAPAEEDLYWLFRAGARL